MPDSAVLERTLALIERIRDWPDHAYLTLPPDEVYLLKRLVEQERLVSLVEWSVLEDREARRA